MNTSSKIVLSGLVVLAFAGGATYYLIQKNLDQLDEKLNQVIKNNQNNLPELTVQENVLNKGFFKSSGTYTITNTSEDPFKIVTNYNIYHGLDYLFNKVVSFDSNSNIMIKDLDITNVARGNKLIHSYGVIDDKGNIRINNNPFDFTSKITEENIVVLDKVNVGQSVFYIDPNKNEFTLSADVVRKQSFFNDKMTADMHNMNIKYVFDTINNKPKEIDLTLKKYQTIGYSLDNTNLKMSFKNEGEKENIETSLKAETVKVTFFPLPFTLESDLLLKGINKDLANNQSGYDKEIVRSKLIKQFKDGFSFELKNMKLKPIGSDNRITFKAGLYASPVNTIEEVKPSKQLGSLFSVSTTGAFTKDALVIYQDLDFIPPGDYSHLDEKEVNLLMQYKDGNLWINDKLSNDSPALTLFSKYFQMFDEIVLKK